jgi:hypothetical protein
VADCALGNSRLNVGANLVGQRIDERLKSGLHLK